MGDGTMSTFARAGQAMSAALAALEEIRVSNASRVTVAKYFAFADPITVPLPSLEGEHLLYRLEWRG